jgi:riboflavin kinase/FMN adenylyltransferase
MVQEFKVFGNKEALEGPCYVTLGNFDGVHKGHAFLLSQLKEQAHNSPTGVITFDPLPALFFHPHASYKTLMTLEERVNALLQKGVDFVVVQPFDEAFASLTPDEFVKDWLCKHFSLKGLMLGYDFRYGYQRQGDFHHMKTYASFYGWDLRQGQVFRTLEGQIVSSSVIRALLKEGEVHKIEECLGRLFCLQGQVIEGAKRGRQIGFPTANIQFGYHEFITYPKYGVYACTLQIKDEKGNVRLQKGILNWGLRPTVSEAQIPQLEVHIFDFKEDIYGQQVTCYFQKFVRAEQKFSSLEALKAQISQDILTCFEA